MHTYAFDRSEYLSVTSWCLDLVVSMEWASWNFLCNCILSSEQDTFAMGPGLESYIGHSMHKYVVFCYYPKTCCSTYLAHDSPWCYGHYVYMLYEGLVMKASVYLPWMKFCFINQCPGLIHLCKYFWRRDWLTEGEDVAVLFCQWAVSEPCDGRRGGRTIDGIIHGSHRLAI